jgi:hypothetical protein
VSTLFDEASRNAILKRLDNLTPQSRRYWGRMTVHQMVCHLSDGYRNPVGERTVPSYSSLVRRTLIKWIALHTPMQWPHGVRTIPEADQEVGGTKPVEFARDIAELKRLIDVFAATEQKVGGHRHAMFGPLTAQEWGVWGYRHADHHLRQFGA